MIAERFRYQDGIGLDRCNACLRLWASCTCTRLWTDPIAPTRPTTAPPTRPRPHRPCACGETRAAEFRASEPRKCKACRRAYNARRKQELRGSR